MSFEDNIRKVVPYVAGEQPQGDVIKLNTNEFPYAPSPMVATRMYDLAEAEIEDRTSMLRKYPNMDAQNLVTAISSVYGIDEDKIFVGVGSDDVIAMAFLTYFNSKKPIIFPDITYSFYDVWADVYGIKYETIPLDEDFKIKKEDYYKENGGIIFPNPNAPTGIYESLDMIEDILQHNKESVVIVDEAYIDFGGKSALELIHKYDNLLVVQTFSKSRALAGLRIGFAFGNEKLIKYLSDVKFSVNSYTMNRPSLVLGTLAIEDDAYFKETVQKIIKTREWMKKELTKLGFSFPDSMSNFVLATHPDYDAEDLLNYLKSKKILVRHFKAPRIKNYLRISVGTDAEARALIQALKEKING